MPDTTSQPLTEPSAPDPATSARDPATSARDPATLARDSATLARDSAAAQRATQAPAPDDSNVADCAPYPLGETDDLPPMNPAQDIPGPPSALQNPAGEQRTLEIGRDIFARVRNAPARDGSLLERWLMNLGMTDPAVKTQLFQFIDVLPVLSRADQVNEHFQQYMASVATRLPRIARHALPIAPTGGWGGRRLADMTQWGARIMARRFIAATDLPHAVRTINALRRRKLGFTIDLLGEAVVSQAEAAAYQNQYLDLIAGLADEAAKWREVELIDRAQGRPAPRVNVSVKLSSLYSQFDPIDPAGTRASVLERLRPILRLARSRGVFVNVDMEHYAFKDLTIDIFKSALLEDEFRDWTDVGIAIQAYLRDTGDDLADLAEWSKSRGSAVWVRLVKGAYWDYESVLCGQNDWPLPVWDEKPQTDASFEAHTAALMRHHELLRPAIASHNVRSIARAIALAEECGVPRDAYEFQMLYGMAEPIKAALAQMGHRVRVYTPFGQLLPGMAYLVRRLLENTSNESFLRAGFRDQVPEEHLLMNPLETLRLRRMAHAGKSSVDARERSARASQGSARAGLGSGGELLPAPMGEFHNEPLADFGREVNRRAMIDALQWVSGRLSGSYPLVIGGKRMDSGQWIKSINPSHKEQVIGRAAAATLDQAHAAVAAARDAFPAWRDTPAERRAELIAAAAGILRRRKWELAAWEVMETGKGWREADADVAEAIDYCEYYAREMLRLDAPRRRDVPGEQNACFYEPRGVVVTISPWNFPMAILCGMTTAALVAGNTVIMKPAEQSPIIAAKLMEVLYESGIPIGVVNYLPGIGQEIGPALVKHPDVAMIAFTGSREVGLEIARQAAQTPAGQDHVKHTIAEMGGKNAVIVDDDADLDQAVAGIVASAFGYAGQKCSACSRVIAIDAIYDALLPRLIEATRSLNIGPAEDPGAFAGPVIDEMAQQRILELIARTRAELPVVYEARLGAMAAEGFYVPPTLFAPVPPDHPIATEEIFGPVLAVIRAADFDEALRIANGTRYALTGGIFSRSPANLERARREFRVGNLYINRKITGALVDRQPFGGLKLSGTGTKAGGPDYLLQFVTPRTITENTLRHGFVPEAGAE